MPLQNEQKNCLISGIEFLINFPTDAVEFINKANAVKKIIISALAHNRKNRLRIRLTNEDEDDYLLFCCIANPAQQFPILKKTQEFLGVVEIQVYIITFIFEQFKKNAALCLPPFVDLPYDLNFLLSHCKSKSCEDIQSSAIPRLESDEGEGEWTWNLGINEKLLFNASITELQDGSIEKAVLIVSVRIPEEDEIIETIPQFIGNKILSQQSELEYRKEIKNFARLIAENHAFKILAKYFSKKYNLYESPNVAGDTASPTIQHHLPAIDFNSPPHIYRTLLNPFYFDFFKKNPALLAKYQLITLDETRKLLSRATIDLLKNRKIKLIQLFALSKEQLHTVEDPYYLAEIIAGNLTIEDILALTTNEAIALLHPPIINLQKKLIIPFNEAKQTSFFTTKLLSEHYYYQGICSGKFTMTDLECTSLIEKNNLSNGNISYLISCNAITPGHAKKLSEFQVKVINTAAFYNKPDKKNLVTLIEKLKDIPYDPEALTFLKSSDDNFDKVEMFIARKNELVNKFDFLLNEQLILTLKNKTAIADSFIQQVNLEIENQCANITFTANDWLSILIKKSLLKIADIFTQAPTTLIPWHFTVILNLIRDTAKMEEEQLSVNDVNKLWLAVLEQIVKMAIRTQYANGNERRSFFLTSCIVIPLDSNVIGTNNLCRWITLLKDCINQLQHASEPKRNQIKNEFRRL